ncbi:hypothetical protein NL533_34450, partial [Klebsiella pneumoniae]|nr:hypothetical protein [Klebsiella pneumoniae]
MFGQLVETGEGWAPSEYTYTADEAASAKATWDAIREEVTQSKGDEWVGFYAGPYSDTGDVLFR